MSGLASTQASAKPVQKYADIQVLFISSAWPVGLQLARGCVLLQWAMTRDLMTAGALQKLNIITFIKRYAVTGLDSRYQSSCKSDIKIKLSFFFLPVFLSFSLAVSLCMCWLNQITSWLSSHCPSLSCSLSCGHRSKSSLLNLSLSGLCHCWSIFIFFSRWHWKKMRARPSLHTFPLLSSTLYSTTPVLLG